MSGRGDNNQHGSAGRGARNQSNQAFVPDGRPEPASDHHKHGDNVRTLNLSVDDVPYVVETESFLFNGEDRYRVKINGGDEHIFAWDNEMNRLRSLDDEAADLPDALELSISRTLLSRRSQGL